MATALAKLVLIVALFVVLQTCWAQQGVCFRRLSASQAYSASTRRSYQTCTRGSWWRRRCSTRYYYVYVTRYRAVYSSQFDCCTWYGSCGYRRCCPACNPRCQSWQVCNVPNSCRCPTGYTGYRCRIRTSPPDPPTNILVTNTSAYSLFIEWRPPNNPNGIITKYIIHLDYNNGTTDVRITDFNTTAYLLEGLSPHQLVGIQIAASTSAGEGPRSPLQQIRTHQAVPTPVTALHATRISDTSLELTWGLPDVLNGIIVCYVVNVSSTSIDFHRRTLRIHYDQPLQLAISDLQPYVPYTIEINAATHAGEGDVNTIVQFTKEGVPHAPGITNISRLSATKIWVAWSQLSLEESRGFLLSYTVAYNENQIRAICPEVNPEASTRTINSSLGNTQLIISNLNPGLEVCVSIAASTVAGTSDFSEARKAPLYFNSQFQLIFSGIHNCNGWVQQNTQEKVMDIISNLVLQLTDTCNCDFSMQYVADPILKCEMDGYAIFQARIISTAENTSTDFLELLQAWASDEPLMVVNYVEIMLVMVMVCSVPVNDIGETECTAPTTTGLPNTTMTTDVALIIAPVMGFLVLIIIIIIIIVIIIIVCTFRRPDPPQVQPQGEYQPINENDVIRRPEVDQDQDEDENRPILKQ